MTATEATLLHLIHGGNGGKKHQPTQTSLSSNPKSGRCTQEARTTWEVEKEMRYDCERGQERPVSRVSPRGMTRESLGTGLADQPAPGPILSRRSPHVSRLRLPSSGLKCGVKGPDSVILREGRERKRRGTTGGHATSSDASPLG